MCALTFATVRVPVVGVSSLGFLSHADADSISRIDTAVHVSRIRDISLHLLSISSSAVGTRTCAAAVRFSYYPYPCRRNFTSLELISPPSPSASLGCGHCILYELVSFRTNNDACIWAIRGSCVHVLSALGMRVYLKAVLRQQPAPAKLDLVTIHTTFVVRLVATLLVGVSKLFLPPFDNLSASFIGGVCVWPRLTDGLGLMSATTMTKRRQARQDSLETVYLSSHIVGHDTREGHRGTRPTAITTLTILAGVLADISQIQGGVVLTQALTADKRW